MSILSFAKLRFSIEKYAIIISTIAFFLVIHFKCMHLDRQEDDDHINELYEKAQRLALVEERDERKRRQNVVH